MASIKYLKKYIISLTEDLKDECLIYLADHPEVTPKSIAEAEKKLNMLLEKLRINVK